MVVVGMAFVQKSERGTGAAIVVIRCTPTNGLPLKISAIGDVPFKFHWDKHDLECHEDP